MPTPKLAWVEPLVATVTVLDDEHAGIFALSERMLRMSESEGTVEVTAARKQYNMLVCVVEFLCLPLARKNVSMLH